MFYLRVTLLFIFLPSLLTGQIKGKVVSVADGDTFTMLVGGKQVKVRLHGIDCPERGQDYGTKAKEYLATLIAGKNVTVKTINTDRYKRTIGIAFVEGRNVNEALLHEGLAWHYKKYDKAERWAALEAAARLARRNIWSMKNPVPPWEWRERKKRRKT